MKHTEEIQQLAEDFQKECHLMVEAIIANSENVNVQDATNVWLYKKLAELQVQLNKLNQLIIV